MIPGVRSTPKSDWAETGMVIFDTDWVEWRGAGRRTLRHKVLNWSLSTVLLLVLTALGSFFSIMLRLNIPVPFFFWLAASYAIIAWTTNLIHFFQCRGWT